MKTLNTLVLGLFFLGFLNAQNNITNEDLQLLHNTSWEGNLMYVNYSDNKEVILQTMMQITIDGNKILMSTQYNNEPSANSKSTIKLRKGGTYLGNEKISKNHIDIDGTITILTEYMGRDDNKPARIYKTYVFGNRQFSVTKEVQFENTDTRFIRNKYSYTKL